MQLTKSLTLTILQSLSIERAGSQRNGRSGLLRALRLALIFNVELIRDTVCYALYGAGVLILNVMMFIS